MDRRQQKTRAAIFQAFGTLLAKKNYLRITVQEIIDTANIGRSTFYVHFETKDDLIRALCQELFDHIIRSAAEGGADCGLYSCEVAPDSVFCHLLCHLQRNEHHLLQLLSGENSELFLRYFKDSLHDLIRSQYAGELEHRDPLLPEDFLVNHIAASFVELVLWWIRGGQKQSPQELTQYFQAVIAPLMQPKTHSD